MSEAYWITNQALFLMSGLWFLLGGIITGIVVFEYMERREYKRICETEQWWSEFVDGTTEEYGYYIQDEHDLMEVSRDEFDIWLAENGLKGIPDIDEDEMFIEWTKGKR